jgi:hypothetical protein
VGLAYSQLESGIVLAQEKGGGYPEIRAALKRHDQNLELGQVAGVWKVYYRFGSEPHQIEFLTDWRDPDGTPRELSHGLVDHVRGQDRNSRVKRPNADELNAQRREQLAKHKARVIEAIDSEHQPILYRKRSAGLHVKEKPW